MWLAVKLDLLPIGVGARSGGVRLLEEWSLTTDFTDKNGQAKIKSRNGKVEIRIGGQRRDRQRTIEGD